MKKNITIVVAIILLLTLMVSCSTSTKVDVDPTLKPTQSIEPQESSIEATNITKEFSQEDRKFWVAKMDKDGDLAFVTLMAIG